jgi:hypothetical protein
MMRLPGNRKPFFILTLLVLLLFFALMQKPVDGKKSQGYWFWKNPFAILSKDPSFAGMTRVETTCLAAKENAGLIAES